MVGGKVGWVGGRVGNMRVRVGVVGRMCGRSWRTGGGWEVGWGIYG